MKVEAWKIPDEQMAAYGQLRENVGTTQTTGWRESLTSGEELTPYIAADERTSPDSRRDTCNQVIFLHHGPARRPKDGRLKPILIKSRAFADRR